MHILLHLKPSYVCASASKLYNCSLHTPHTHNSRYVCFSTDLVPIDPSSPLSLFNLRCQPQLLTSQLINPTGSSLSFLFSPDFGLQATYPSSRLCRYSLPQCPPGHVQQLFWSAGDFQLQDSFQGSAFCLDFLQFFLQGLDLGTAGAALDPFALPSQVLCGSQGDFSLEIGDNSAVQVRARL